MALSHNAFIRGFNSIYQQAPRVPPADKSDFVGYCLAWHDCVEAHHSYEETDLFPNVNKAAGTTGLMETAVQEHGNNNCPFLFSSAFYSHMCCNLPGIRLTYLATRIL